MRAKEFLLNIAYRTNAHRLLRLRYGGLGTIFMMHRVVRRKEDALAGLLTTTTAYLEAVIRTFRKNGFTFVALAQVDNYLDGVPPSAPFVALTFDDGYRDNLELALPILEKYGVPATIYVSTGAPDRTLKAWWLRIETALARKGEVALDLPNLPARLSLPDHASKCATYQLLSDYLPRTIEVNAPFAESLLPLREMSDEALLDSYFMSWDELRSIAGHPLITIGAHTVTHRVLTHLERADALWEMKEGRSRLAAELSVPAEHFAYPFGECAEREFGLAQEAGFKTAVTTRRGNIFAEHAIHRMALPRFPLGGLSETMKEAELNVSGAPIGIGSRWLNPVVTA